jgi:hypothetical protein
MKKLIYTTILCLAISFAFSQNNKTINNGRIIGSLDLGSQEVTTILDESTSCIRKSSPHTKGLFVPDEKVELIIKENQQLVEVIKESLIERVYASKECKTTGLSDEEESFIILLENTIDSIIDNNITNEIERIINPYDGFADAHRDVLTQFFLEYPDTTYNIEWLSNIYKLEMTNLGFGKEFDELPKLRELYNSHNTSSNKNFSDLRNVLYSEYNLSKFSINIAELIYSKSSVILSKENVFSMLATVEKMIYESSLIEESEKNQLLKSLSIGINNIEVFELAANPGSWKDCAGFAISFIGAFSNPFSAVLGVAGMALSAGGCESWLS